MTIDIPLVSVSVSPEARRRVASVLDSGRLAQGPVVEELEAAFATATGTQHCVAVTNGTVALEAALECLGVERGQEVITTPFTFVATVNSALAVGARVRFADVLDDYTIDPTAVAGLLNPATACVVPVHLFGMPSDVPAIRDAVGDRGVRILEDAAQAHGALLEDRRAGALGDAGCFSLYATKNLSAGEGGLITTDDAAFADRLRVLRNQGMRARYEYVGPGRNLRMSDLHAAVVLDDVYRLKEVNARRSRNAEQLLHGLDGINGLILPVVPPGRHSAWHQFTVRLTADACLPRDEFMAALARLGVGSDVFYPQALSDVPHLETHPDVAQDPVPNARRMAAEVVSLPVGHHLDEAEIARVVSAVREVLDA